MQKMLVAALLSCVSISVHAGTGGFFQGGYSNSTLEIEDDQGSNIDIDSGGGFNIAGGVTFDPGIMIRAAYDTTNHESGDGCVVGVGCGTFDDADIDINETRLGAFWAPPTKGVVGFRVGGGYEKVELDVDGDSADSDGGFVEGNLLLNAGTVVTFDLGAAAFFLSDDEDDSDTTGAEFRASAFFHAGPVDIGVGVRSIALNSEADNGDEEDFTFTEYLLTLGTAWGGRD